MTALDPARTVVTGATGLVGRALAALMPGPARRVALSGADWEAQVAAADWKDAVVFHLAARVHEPGNEDAAAYDRDNVLKTRALAQAAARGGARRLVFASSIKVNGEATTDRPFRADDVPAPSGGYATSKWRAEQALHEVARESGLEVVIVRAPLVMGPGARGNLHSLLALADSPWPLPFAAIANRRALIDVEDLARLLLTSATHPAAAGATLLCEGPRAVSTPELVTALRGALRRPRGLFAMSPQVFVAAGASLGQGDRVRRLIASLEVDAAATRSLLGWKPEVTLESSAAKMARHWREVRA